MMNRRLGIGFAVVVALCVALGMMACDGASSSKPEGTSQRSPAKTLSLTEGAAQAEALLKALHPVTVATKTQAAQPGALRLLIAKDDIHLDTTAWMQQLPAKEQQALLKRSKNRLAAPRKISKPKTLAKRLKQINKWMEALGKAKPAQPALYLIADASLTPKQLVPLMEALGKSHWDKVFWLVNHQSGQQLIPTQQTQAGRLIDKLCPNAELRVEPKAVRAEINRTFMNVVRYGNPKPQWKLKVYPQDFLRRMRLENGPDWKPEDGSPALREDIPAFVPKVFGKDDVKGVFDLTTSRTQSFEDLQEFGLMLHQNAERCSEIRFQVHETVTLQTLLDVFAAASAKSPSSIMLFDLHWLNTGALEETQTPKTPEAPAPQQAEQPAQATP